MGSSYDLTRRRMLGITAAGAAAATLGVRAPARAARTITLGFVSPQTGPLAAFGEADSYVLSALRKRLADGITIGGTKYPIAVVVKDSQSSPNRAGEVASELILQNKVDLMLVSSTPETTNPVADQCELNAVPCISTVTPWQAWFFPRHGDPAKGFEWTYHFFWGLEDVESVFLGMWNQVSTNKLAGGLFPNDGDGNAWADPVHGMPPVLAKDGYKLNDPGHYQDLTADCSAQISAFKKGDCEVLTGVPLPPDFKNFWTQAHQQGYRPKIASIGKALLFPSSIEALGPIGNGLTSEVWWTPAHPFHSSLTGQSAGQLAAAYSAATGKQWTQPLGFSHALFEVAVHVLSHASDVNKKEAIRDALATASVDTVVGPVRWGKGPVKNVAKTLLVGGQWEHGKKYPYELVIVENALAKEIPLQGKVKPLA
ncbi:MAG TPA: ABC transporter substrate-binding protein [Candidatus Sulfotelmatobacter sp.]|nr:ABC transporter substrate-binding protein [Candidatus Sulfotelmatobacter sp.]